MKSFEEQFPSYSQYYPSILHEILKDKGVRDIGFEGVSVLTEEKPYEMLMEEAMNKFMVEHCIDKQLVRNALKSGRSTKYPNTNREEYWVQVDEKKWKRLGL